MPGPARTLRGRRRPQPLAYLKGLFAAEPWLLVIAVITAAAYATYSILNHLHFGTYAYDLGIFDQVIWHYSRFEIPETTVVGLPTALGDHFEPILVALVPLYWVWSDPRMLLGAQAVLIAASIVPVFVWCRERLGRAPAYALTGAYVMFWGVHSAVAFDFHEIAFAPLILASMLVCAERRRWTATFALLAVLLLVKENLGLLVAFFGLYLLTYGERRKAAVVAVIGVAWYFVTTKLAIPYFSGGRPFRHFRYQQFGSDLPGALAHMARYPWTVVQVFFDQDAKVRTLALTFLPFLGLVFLSPLAILLIPLLAERMYSTNPFLWGTSAHYSLVLAPILVMGSADGLARLLRWVKARHPLAASPPRLRAFAMAATVAMLGINVWTLRDFPTRALLDPAFYSLSPADRMASRMISLVPPGASVAAQSHFVPHLSERKQIFQLGPGEATTEYIVANSGLDFQLRYPQLRYIDKRRMLLDRADRYGAIFYDDGWVVLKRYQPAQASVPRPDTGS